MTTLLMLCKRYNESWDLALITFNVRGSYIFHKLILVHILVVSIENGIYDLVYLTALTFYLSAFVFYLNLFYVFT